MFIRVSDIAKGIILGIVRFITFILVFGSISNLL